MMTTSATSWRVLGGAIAIGCTLALSSTLLALQKDAKKPAEDQGVTVAEAKVRAKLLHNVYSSTLDSMHHHFFRRERAVLPARAMEDIFDDMEKETKIKARWIAVNTPAMSVDHEAESDFEKKAVEEISSGKLSYERVEKGFYKRAGAIPLTGGCVGCHTKFFTSPPKTPRFAALVISIPVKE